MSLKLHLRGLVGSAERQFGQALLTFVFLPYDAYISLDAIGRTLVRLLITRKRLLEWQTASDVERTARISLAGFYATMWIAPIVALACWSFMALTLPSQFPLAASILGLWLFSPWIAWRISQPIEASAVPELNPKQLAFLRRTAQDLALFRNLRHGKRTLAASG
jgi:FtsH-binding integral membrane protein